MIQVEEYKTHFYIDKEGWKPSPYWEDVTQTKDFNNMESALKWVEEQSGYKIKDFDVCPNENDLQISHDIEDEITKDPIGEMLAYHFFEVEFMSEYKLNKEVENYKDGN